MVFIVGIVDDLAVSWYQRLLCPAVLQFEFLFFCFVVFNFLFLVTVCFILTTGPIHARGNLAFNRHGARKARVEREHVR